MLARMIFALLTVLTPALLGAGSPAIAQDAAGSWRISKSSGDVSVSTQGLQLVALTNGMTLQSGDSVRTGQNGRVLLVRGNETILISANSALSLPKDKKDGLSTTILQQAGSILLEVEKRSVNHFEVETPHLSAVVKGTRFHVTVNANDSRVGVFKGQVEVTDFKSSQHSLINAGQSASVSVQGPVGLSVTGTGLLSPIQQGTPRRSAPPPVPERDASLTSPSPAAPAQRQTHTPLLGQTDTVALPERDATQRRGWGLAALGEQTLTSRKDVDTFSLAFPLVVGAFVAMTIAVRRRWKRHKLERGSGQ